MASKICYILFGLGFTLLFFLIGFVRCATAGAPRVSGAPSPPFTALYLIDRLPGIACSARNYLVPSSLRPARRDRGGAEKDHGAVSTAVTIENNTQNMRVLHIKPFFLRVPVDIQRNQYLCRFHITITEACHTNEKTKRNQRTRACMCKRVLLRTTYEY